MAAMQINCGGALMSGFESFNDAGAYQVDGNFRNLMLRRKLIMSTATASQGNSRNFSEVTFATAGDEVIALRSDTACALIGQTTVSGRVMSTGPVGTAITAYIFAPVTDIGTHFGLQTFDAAGALTFDAAQKPLACAGFPEGEGAFTYSGSRTYAALMLNQRYVTAADAQGVSPSIMRVVYVQSCGIAAVPGGIKLAFDTFYLDVREAHRGDEYYYASSPTSRHIIVDVTNY